MRSTRLAALPRAHSVRRLVGRAGDQVFLAIGLELRSRVESS